MSHRTDDAGVTIDQLDRLIAVLERIAERMDDYEQRRLAAEEALNPKARTA